MAMLVVNRLRALSLVRVRRLLIISRERKLSSYSDEGNKDKVPKPHSLSKFENETPEFDVDSVKSSPRKSVEDYKKVQTYRRNDNWGSAWGKSLKARRRGIELVNATHNRMKEEYSRHSKNTSAAEIGSLLNTLNEPNPVPGQEMLKTFLSEWKKESESKTLGSLIPSVTKPSPVESSSSAERPKKTLEDVDNERASLGAAQSSAGKAMHSKIKELLSELKVHPKDGPLDQKITFSVENWGKSTSTQVLNMKKEYQSQSGEWQSTSVRRKRVEFLTGDRPKLFDNIIDKERVVKLEESEGAQNRFLLHIQEIEESANTNRSEAKHNAFRDQINLSDRLWQYPIDNEVCKVEEKDVSFEEHVFLEYLLDDFPSKGPVRRFMELVINGLQQNPHLTVKQKKERVHWFHNYFAQFSEEDLNF